MSFEQFIESQLATSMYRMEVIVVANEQRALN